MHYNKIREIIQIKADILAEGINIDDSIKQLHKYNPRKNHLYDHSPESLNFRIPEDIILLDNIYNKSIIVRNRINSKSEWTLYTDSQGVYIKNSINNQRVEVTFPSPLVTQNQKINNQPIDKIVTKLGTDLCGIIFSNNCFYFGSKDECKFCEILPTYLEYKSYPTATKKVNHIIEAFESIVSMNDDFEHLVITTGNYVNYDETVKVFCEIGKGIKSVKNNNSIISTATLMPPDDFTLIDKLKESGFDNVYFDLELYDRNLFEIITPGKAKYGYDKLINALEYAVKVFGKGHVFTNLVYGIQSSKSDFSDNMVDAKKENQICLEASEYLISKDIVPVFTVYHSSGRNEMGVRTLNKKELFNFFEAYGQLLYKSKIVNNTNESIIFSLSSTSNTMYNDGYVLAKIKEQEGVIKCS